MRLILLTKAHFYEVCHKMNMAHCTVGNLPTPTLIVPLSDIVYMIGEKVEVSHCDTAEFEEFLNGGPITLMSLKRYVSGETKEVSDVG
jgi:hypothetical protein